MKKERIIFEVKRPFLLVKVYIGLKKMGYWSLHSKSEEKRKICNVVHTAGCLTFNIARYRWVKEVKPIGSELKA